jgi:perosamine synthetase
VPERQMISIYQPHWNGREKEYVNQCLDSTWISSKGEFIAKFEAGFAAYVGVVHATSVCSGTAALHLALSALGLGPGDEVIVPTLTYIASVNAILYTGATPIYVDVSEDTWQMNPDDVLRKTTSHTKAVMAVHLYGLPCPMDRLVALCREHRLLLIEDCAEAFGAYYKGKHVGTFGDISAFSFFGNKTITTGEGGMVVTGDNLLIGKAYHLKTQGVSPEREYWHDVVGYNYRMTNICAAIGLAQLEQADIILTKKSRVADWYKKGLQDLPLRLQGETADAKHSHWMCSVAVDNAEHRQPLRDYLRASGIETRPFFYPAHTLPHCTRKVHLPVAESLSRRGISLPSYPDLSEEQVETICGAMRQYFIGKPQGRHRQTCLP